jgi:hypothetical protein
MEYAKDRKGNIVRAREAMKGGYRFYACPVCKAEVFARRGKRRTPHFAHRAGQALPECELYFPPGYIKGPVTPLPSRHEWGEPEDGGVRPQLQLGIELEPETHPKASRLRRWGLRLTVPKSTQRHGQIQVDCGPIHKPRISLEKLSLSPQTYAADLNTPTFGVTWFSPEVGRFYQESLAERIPGLDRDLFNVFQARQEKIKPRALNLSWGEAYFFIWHEKLSTSFPAQFARTSLAQNGEWCCALIALPSDGDGEVQAWLRAHCGLSAAQERRRWSTIFPVAYALDIYGQTLVAPGKTLFLRTYNTDGASAVSALTIRAGRENGSVSLPEGTTRAIVEIDASRVADTESISLQWDGHSISPIRRQPQLATNLAPTVAITFRSVLERGSVSARFHEVSAREGLDRVRAGESLVKEVALPAGIDGTLSWRPLGSMEWLSEAFGVKDAATSTTVSIPDVALSTLNAVLKDRIADVRLDFGAFGSYFSPGAAATARASSVRLAPELRRRVIWLCKTSKFYVSIDGTVLADMDDAALLDHFGRCSIPHQLVAHSRALKRALTNASGARIE